MATSDFSKTIKAMTAKQAAEREAAARPTDARPTDARPMGARTAAYGANLREQIKAGTMTNAQAQALHNANVKQEMAKPTQAPVPSVVRSPEQAYQDYMGQRQQQSTTPNRNLLGALRPGVTPPTSSTSQQPTSADISRIRGVLGGLSPTGSTPSQTVAPHTPSMGGGVKPGFQNPPSMSLTAPSGPASGPPTTRAAAKLMKKGGKVSKPVKKMAKGGSTASSRGDGCAVRGKTKGTMR